MSTAEQFSLLGDARDVYMTPAPTGELASDAEYFSPAHSLPPGAGLYPLAESYGFSFRNFSFLPDRLSSSARAGASAAAVLPELEGSDLSSRVDCLFGLSTDIAGGKFVLLRGCTSRILLDLLACRKNSGTIAGLCQPVALHPGQENSHAARQLSLSSTPEQEADVWARYQPHVGHISTDAHLAIGHSHQRLSQVLLATARRHHGTPAAARAAVAHVLRALGLQHLAALCLRDCDVAEVAGTGLPGQRFVSTIAASAIDLPDMDHLEQLASGDKSLRPAPLPLRLGLLELKLLCLAQVILQRAGVICIERFAAGLSHSDAVTYSIILRRLAAQGYTIVSELDDLQASVLSNADQLLLFVSGKLLFSGAPGPGAEALAAALESLYPEHVLASPETAAAARGSLLRDADLLVEGFLPALMSPSETPSAIQQMDLSKALPEMGALAGEAPGDGVSPFAGADSLACFRAPYWRRRPALRSRIPFLLGLNMLDQVQARLHLIPLFPVLTVFPPAMAFFLSIFYDMRPDHSDQASARLAQFFITLSLFLVVVPLLLSAGRSPSGWNPGHRFLSRRVAVRQSRLGTDSAWLFTLSTLLVDALFVAMLAVLWVVPVVYSLPLYHWPGIFGQYWLSTLFMGLFGLGLLDFTIDLCQSPGAAARLFTFIALVFIVPFGNFFVYLPLMLRTWGWIFWINPMHYAFAGCCIAELYGNGKYGPLQFALLQRHHYMNNGGGVTHLIASTATLLWGLFACVVVVRVLSAISLRMRSK
ncbi:hypothetical protein H696_04236 [Fonticula alba]|uniref:ABC-2 type transporter transmembrane domain-containing protein n=1 Tax=Fonticula alba TaxID=691883 RepID=A0A058Z3E9_FONAL|nr:hypothetical protein H696_04236 [Fonticula alba]KCV68819.1 hypothetical protein H696_04236 [Fonticula alba]|eukprot:XP_009496390.1 hypothetical protein H696_04236 [Fonticula alba]